ncbi:hypothetical protein [Lyngbya confervoides]|uniref:Uncharacterized protein n=1 Tax=Lyngbya confervoides BDU141951 TaxID=1574623 RepID=A0ABD4T3I2_9CYAN|nr:hypothetical protein [Lyngbya confervoides]MCM1983376.1 hypothetical protein [Lyngbya confervoides BDU141951]
MAGFLGLGGSSESYFLEPDDAKSMGDIEYMRTPKKVKRTFAKSKGWGVIDASEKTVSAYDQRGATSAASSQSGSYTQSTPTYQASESMSQSSPSTPTPTRRPVDTSMDMFRNMAKKIR